MANAAHATLPRAAPATLAGMIQTLIWLHDGAQGRDSSWAAMMPESKVLVDDGGGGGSGGFLKAMASARHHFDWPCTSSPRTAHYMTRFGVMVFRVWAVLLPSTVFAIPPVDLLSN
jgi:hypothetical protein